MIQNACTYTYDALLRCAIVFTGWYSAALSHLRDYHSSTLMQYWVLLKLHSHEPMSVSDMQQSLDVNYTTIAECVTTLENRGLVTKARSTEDMRLYIVRITPEGISELKALDESLYKFSRSAWQNVRSDHRKRALALFSRSCALVGKSRLSQGLIRGDSDFLVLCAQITIDIQRACAEIAVSLNQAKILLLLYQHKEGMRNNEIAAILGVRAYEISKTVSKMVQSGYVLSERGLNGRERIVSLTAKGSQKAVFAARKIEYVVNCRFGWIEDRDFFFDIVGELAKGLNK